MSKKLKKTITISIEEDLRGRTIGVSYTAKGQHSSVKNDFLLPIKADIQTILAEIAAELPQGF